MGKQKNALYPLVGKNIDRAEWARVAVIAFGLETGVHCEDMETQISDLVADLKHLACAEGVDWDIVEKRANMHYRYENAWRCKKCKRTFDAESDPKAEEDRCCECVPRPGVSA